MSISKNFITIQGWMVTELNLSGNNLLTFSLIYGFCQDGESEFTGSINYICKWLNCSRPTAMKSLKELTDLGFIKKNQVVVNGVTFNRYSIILGGVKKLDGGSKDSLLGGSKDSLPNNNSLNIYNDIIESKDENPTCENQTLVEFKGYKLPKTHIDLCSKMMNDLIWLDTFMMNNHYRKKEQVKEHLFKFCIHLNLESKTYELNKFKDFKSHFNNWHRIPKSEHKQQNQPKITGEAWLM